MALQGVIAACALRCLGGSIQVRMHLLPVAHGFALPCPCGCPRLDIWSQHRVQGRLWPRDENERQRAIDEGYDLDKILHTADLCTGNRVFFAATGISDGDLVRGVRYESRPPLTSSRSDSRVYMFTSLGLWRLFMRL